MEISYSSPLRILRPNYNASRLQTRKYCNLRKIRSPVSPSLGFKGYDPHPDPKNIATVRYKHNSIRACDKAGSDPIITTRKAPNFGETCWRFLRPNPQKGMVIASSCLLARVLIENPNLIEWSLVFKALSGLVTLLCASSYIAVINQIYDVEIDKINKPYLPIAAGDISVKSAWLLAVFSAVVGLSIVGLTCDPLITCVYVLGLFMGTAYSVPPLRFKKHVFGTILSTTSAFGIFLNFGVYYSARATVGLAFQWSTPLIYIIIFGLVVSFVLAITKDLSDVEGDAKFGITTLAIKLGVRNVVYLGCGLMLAYYAASILASIYMPQALNPRVIIPAHLVLALSLIHQARVLEQANYSTEASIKFYQFACNLHYAGYIMFPFI